MDIGDDGSGDEDGSALKCQESRSIGKLPRLLENDRFEL